MALLALPCHADWREDYDNILSVCDHRDKKVRREHATLHRCHPELWRSCAYYQMIRMQENTGLQAVGNNWLIGRIRNSGI
jgi:hypothetical protein